MRRKNLLWIMTLFIITIVPITYAVPTNTLVMALEFNDNTTSDEMGLITCGVNSTPTYNASAGFMNGAYEFGGYGSGDFVHCGDLSSYFGMEATLVLWYRVNNYFPVSGEDSGMYDIGQSTQANHLPYVNGDFYIDPFRNDYQHIPAGTNHSNSTSWTMHVVRANTTLWQVWENNNWQYDGAGEPQVYLPTNLTLGADRVTGENQWLNGAITAFYIWNETLSEADLTNLYNGGLGLEYPFLSDVTSMRVGDFEISDTSVASSSYVQVANVSIVVDTGTNYSIFSSMQAMKTNGGSSSTLSLNLSVDGTSVKEVSFQQYSSIGSSDIIGFDPFLFELSAGTHNLTLEAKTSTGVVELSNIDFLVMEQGLTSGDYYLNHNETTVSFTHTDSSSFQEAFNFTVTKAVNSSTFMVSRLLIEGVSGITDPVLSFKNLNDGSLASFMETAVYYPIGTYMGLNWIDGQNTSHTDSILAKEDSTGGAGNHVNGSILYFDLVDANSATVEYFYNSSSSTNFTDTVTLTPASNPRTLATGEINLTVGNAVMITLSTSLETSLGLGSSFVTWVDFDGGVNASECQSVKSRGIPATYAGNAQMYFLCKGLSTGVNYNVTAYVNVTEVGQNVFLIDEALQGIEATEISLTLNNVAPTGGVITEPNSDDIVGGANVNVSWQNFTDPNGDDLTYNVTVNGTLVSNATDENCTFDSTALTDGVHILDVVAIDDSGLTTNQSILIEIDNTDPVTTVTFPVGQWTNFTVSGTCVDANPYNMTVNDSRFTWNSSVAFASWEFYVNETITNVSVLFTCYDVIGNSNSTTKNLSVDSVPPSCSPVLDASLNIGASFDWNVTCIDDLNLYSLNVTCTQGVSYSFYQDSLNTTSFNFIANSGAIFNASTCYFITKDAHTLNDVTDVLNPFTVKNNATTVRIDNKQIVSLDTGMTDPEVLDLELDFSSLDRVRYTYAFDSIEKGTRTYVFYVTGEHKVVPIRHDAFPAWFVVDDTYWVDFALKNGTATYDIYRINDSAYSVIVRSEAHTLEFQSVGVLNTNTQAQSFFVEGGGTLSVGECPDNVTQVLVLYLILGFGCFLMLMGWVFRLAVAGFFGSLAVCASSWYVVACQTSIGWIIAGFGGFFTLWFAMKGLKNRDDLG